MSLRDWLDRFDDFMAGYGMPSQSCLSTLSAIHRQGGSASEVDNIVEGCEQDLYEGMALGLLRTDGGWGGWYFITRRGRRVLGVEPSLSPRAPLARTSNP